MNKDISEEEIMRRKSLESLNSLDINPYPAELFDVKNYSSFIKQDYKDPKQNQPIRICL